MLFSLMNLLSLKEEQTHCHLVRGNVSEANPARATKVKGSAFF